MLALRHLLQEQIQELLLLQVLPHPQLRLIDALIVSSD